MDDVGASSKYYNLHGNPKYRFSNFLFFKAIRPFGKWGIYRELKKNEWIVILELLERYNAKLTVGITASWVTWSGEMIAFNKRFPLQAAILKEGLQQGLIEIANHGLTHCVLKDHLFRPRLFSSNRNYHREFWDWVPLETQKYHIAKSQEILQDYFNVGVETFIPPGNVWISETGNIAFQNGIKYISCLSKSMDSGIINKELMYISDSDNVVLHDRDIVLGGLDWFYRLLENNRDNNIVTVKEYAKVLKSIQLYKY